MTDPADVAQRFCTALDHGDWLAITALTDPEWLHDFADERLEHARSLERASERQEYAGPPDAPPEVRRWFAERTVPGLALSSLAEDFAGIQTAAELETLTPAQIAAKALQGLFGRARGEIARTWLGVVSEGADHAHAVYRVRFPSVPDDEGSVGILSMRRTPTGWRVLWDGQGPFGLPGFGPHTYMVARAPQGTDPAA
jgi:hypothetical protein